MNLNHFRLLRVVGKGAFGKVRIVERKDTGLTFALKYIRKDEGQSHKAKSNEQVVAHVLCSGSIGERPEYYSRAAHAGTFGPSFSMQLAVELPRYRVFV